MASYAKFDVWQNTQGVNYNTPIQVVSTAIHTDCGTTSNDQTNNSPSTYGLTTTTTTWTDYAYMQLSITPKFASSKIKLDLSWYHYSGGNAYAGALRIRRGTTIVWRPMMNTTGPFSMGYAGGSDTHMHYHISVIDSPATTSSITYVLQYRTYNGGGTSRFFHWDSSGHWAPPATFTAMEIAQ